MDHSFARPVPLTEVVTMATGLDPESLSRTTAKTLTHNLDKLQTHLTAIGSTVCRQYFRLTWVSLLGPALAWLIMIMRSRCYYNPETEELRDTYTWRKKDLAATLGQTTRNLSNLLADPQTGLFCQITEQNKRKLTIRVTMVYEPLTSVERQDPTDQDDDSLQRNRKKAPVTGLEPEKIRSLSSESEKISAHSF